MAILKYTDILCSSEECHPSREIVLPDPKLLDYYQSLTDQGESKYPTPAPPPQLYSSHLRRRKKCEKVTAQREKLSKRPRPYHRTVELFSPTPTLPPHQQGAHIIMGLQLEEMLIFGFIKEEVYRESQRQQRETKQGHQRRF